MTTSSKIRASVALAVGAGLALRLYLIHRFPMNAAGDSEIYLELARNWLDHGVYGMSVNGHLTPVDLRSPGYPAFLAAVYATVGRSRYAVLLAQALVDLATCGVVAMLAARVAPAGMKRWAASWLGCGWRRFVLLWRITARGSWLRCWRHFLRRWRWRCLRGGLNEDGVSGEMRAGGIRRLAAKFVVSWRIGGGIWDAGAA